MLNPALDPTPANVAIIANVQLGATIRAGRLVGRLQRLTLANAYCDPATGQWQTRLGTGTTRTPIEFTVDAAGNVLTFDDEGQAVPFTGEMAAAAPAILQAWGALVVATEALHAALPTEWR